MKSFKNITATHWGILTPTVENGVLTGLSRMSGDYGPTALLRHLAQLPYCEARIKNPSIRESFLKNGRGPSEDRGKEPFVEVSWEEAFSLVAGELDHVYKNYGPSAVFGRSYGWKSTGLVNSPAQLIRRLLNLCGGFVPTTNSYSTAAISSILPYVVGERLPVSTSWDEVLKHSDFVVFIGCDPITTNNLDWCTTLNQGMTYLSDLKISGIPSVSINPIRDATSKFLGNHWLGIHPGTDCALMLALIFEIKQQKLIDYEFINKYTSGWGLFEDYVCGRSDGIPKTAIWAESVTGINASVIQQLALKMATCRTMIMMGYGNQRRQWGEQSHWMGYALASALGQIGLPGGGLGVDYHYCQGGARQCRGPGLSGIDTHVKPIRPFKKSPYPMDTLPISSFADCFLHPGKSTQFNGKKITYPEIRLAIWGGGNPFAHQPEIAKTLKAWKKLDTIIIVDSVWTPSAKTADIVLPACTAFERMDITDIGTNTNDGIAASHQLIEPQGNSLSDFKIFEGIAKKLGIGQEFTGGLDEEGWIRRIYSEAFEAGERMGLEMPNFEAFWEKGIFFYPEQKEAGHVISFESFRKDPDNHPLKTESGKIQIFSERIQSYHYEDCPGMPTFFEPRILHDHQWNKHFQLISPKHPIRLHSQLDACINGEQKFASNQCWIHPLDASKHDIQDGDYVLVESSVGKALMTAHVTENIVCGTLMAQHGVWYSSIDVVDEIIDGNGCPNSVIEDIPTSSLARGNVAANDSVTIKKWTGPIPNSFAYKPPQFTSL